MAKEDKKETTQAAVKTDPNLGEISKLKQELKELKDFKAKFSETSKKPSNETEIASIKAELQALKDYKKRTEQWESHLDKGGKKEQKSDFFELLEKGVKTETINKLLNAKIKDDSQAETSAESKQQVTSDMISQSKEKDETDAQNEADEMLDKKKSYSSVY